MYRTRSKAPVVRTRTQRRDLVSNESIKPARNINVIVRKNKQMDNAELEDALYNIAIRESLDTLPISDVPISDVQISDVPISDTLLISDTAAIQNDAQSDVSSNRSGKSNGKKNYKTYGTDVPEAKNNLECENEVKQKSNYDYGDLVRISTRRESQIKTPSTSISQISQISTQRVNIVVGRGRTDVIGCKNFPIDTKIFDHSVIYIDASNESVPDIVSRLEDFDFRNLKLADVTNEVCIYFDWSTFYCTILPEINKILLRLYNLGKKVKIYIPLYPEDTVVPGDVARHLIVGGNYVTTLLCSCIPGIPSSIGTQ